MIDWSNKDSLRRRDNPDVRAVNVHAIPEWVKTKQRFIVEWSDGMIKWYYEDSSWYGDGTKAKCDVIPAPRSGEGWIWPDHKEPCIQAEQGAEGQIKIRWEEVIE